MRLMNELIENQKWANVLGGITTELLCASTLQHQQQEQRMQQRQQHTIDPSLPIGQVTLGMCRVRSQWRHR